MTPSLSSKRHRVLSGEGKALAASTSLRCTTGCTREGENEHGTTGEADVDQARNDAEPAAGEGADSLAMLAAALVNLSAADRAKLAAMLLAGDGGKAK